MYGITALICWLEAHSQCTNPLLPIVPIQQSNVDCAGIIRLSALPSSDKYSDGYFVLKP